MPLAPGRARSAFTLAEVAVTVVIVGLGLTMVLQGLNASQLTAQQTRNTRLARELGLETLGQIESGLFWDDIVSGASGAYEDHPEFEWELALGDDTFPGQDEDESYDTWSQRRRLREERSDYDKDEDEETHEEYEKVRVRVTFPKIQQLKNELSLERWMPWEQVYGPDEESRDKGSEVSSGEASSPQ
jgi:type II secretory pathway pseudopilin PulG